MTTDTTEEPTTEAATPTPEATPAPVLTRPTEGAELKAFLERIGGLSRVTIAAFISNPTVYAWSGESKEKPGKFVGIIELTDARDRPRIMVSTQPIFDTADAAKADMELLIAQARLLPDPFGGNESFDDWLTGARETVVKFLESQAG